MILFYAPDMGVPVPIFNEHMCIHASDLLLKIYIVQAFIILNCVFILVLCLWLASEFLKRVYHIISILHHLT